MTETLKDRKIGGIPATAPTFRGAPIADLDMIVDAMRRASYHFAAERGEMRLAAEEMATMAQLVNKHRIGVLGIKLLYREASPIMELGHVLDVVLATARAAAPNGGN